MKRWRAARSFQKYKALLASDQYSADELDKLLSVLYELSELASRKDGIQIQTSSDIRQYLQLERDMQAALLHRAEILCHLVERMPRREESYYIELWDDLQPFLSPPTAFFRRTRKRTKRYQKHPSIGHWIKVGAVSCTIIIAMVSIGFITLARPVRQAVVAMFSDASTGEDIQERNMVNQYVPMMDQYTVLNVDTDVPGVLHVVYLDETSAQTIEYWMYTSLESSMTDNGDASITEVKLFGHDASVLSWPNGIAEIQGVYNDGLDNIGFFHIRGYLTIEEIQQLASTIHLEEGR